MWDIYKWAKIFCQELDQSSVQLFHHNFDSFHFWMEWHGCKRLTLSQRMYCSFSPPQTNGIQLSPTSLLVHCRRALPSSAWHPPRPDPQSVKQTRMGLPRDCRQSVCMPSPFTASTCHGNSSLSSQDVSTKNVLTSCTS